MQLLIYSIMLSFTAAEVIVPVPDTVTLQK